MGAVISADAMSPTPIRILTLVYSDFPELFLGTDSHRPPELGCLLCDN